MQSDEELSARLSLLENQVSEVRGEVRRNIARAATVFSAMLFLKSFLRRAGSSVAEHPTFGVAWRLTR